MIENRRFLIDATSLPDLPGMMLSIVEALKNLGGSATIHELDDKVIDLEGVTEDELAFTMARNENRPRVSYYLAWARTYLRRGKAIVNSSRGVWALTDSGMGIASLEKTRAIYDKVTIEERNRARAKRQAAKRVDPGAVELEETDAADDWKASLLTALGAMPSDAFERLSQRILREEGFTKVEVKGKSGEVAPVGWTVRGVV